MFTTYVVLTVLTAAALTFSATADFVRYQRVLDNMTRAGVPHSWLNVLASLKAAGAVGLLVGIAVRPIGIAAAIGVILFFLGAIVTHVRARWYSFSYPSAYLGLAVATLAFGAVGDRRQLPAPFGSEMSCSS
ncbi:MAG: DoxX family protein [Acidimicrobiales bacterium]